MKCMLKVALAVHKLPPSWREFRTYLLHKRKEMTYEDLMTKLRIEEDNKGREKNTTESSYSKANVVEHRSKHRPGGKQGQLKKAEKHNGKGQRI